MNDPRSATPPAPLFRDPVYDGAADPAIIWNRNEQAWWILYTNRRATAPAIGKSWIHGTRIGVASSDDGGATWVYRGTVSGLEFEPGTNTFWAPEVLFHDGLYHMYASYVRGVPTTWEYDRRIVHYTSDDLWSWQLQSVLDLDSPRVIDAAVHELPEGGWRMWYKDEGHSSHTYAADSDDLFTWRVAGPVVTDFGHEGPNVFRWRGAYWLIADYWKGQLVMRSEDCRSWVRQADILDTPGTRHEDNDVGRHADVLVRGEEAYIFYFTHPGRDTGDPRRSSLQIARLDLDAERTLVCDRDARFALDLGRL
ncbi:MAG: glycosyl hydrolase [Spirochaetota bacterium]